MRSLSLYSEAPVVEILLKITYKYAYIVVTTHICSFQRAKCDQGLRGPQSRATQYSNFIDLE